MARKVLSLGHSGHIYQECELFSVKPSEPPGVPSSLGTSFTEKELDFSIVKTTSRVVRMIKISVAKVAGFKLSFDVAALKQQEQPEKANGNYRSLVEQQISRLPETRGENPG